MDSRHAIAYLLILLIVLGVGGAYLWTTREQRAERRAGNRHERQRVRRNRDRIRDEEAA